MGLYDDDAALEQGDLSFHQGYAEVTKALAGLGTPPSAAALRALAREDRGEALAKLYGKLHALTVQFPKHVELQALVATAQALPEAAGVPASELFPQLAKAEAALGKLRGLARDVPRPGIQDVLEAVRLATEARHQLKWVPHVPGAATLLATIERSVAEVQAAAGVEAPAGDPAALSRRIKLEAVLARCSSLEVAPMGVCLGCDLRLTREHPRGFELVVGCELKQGLTPLLQVAFARRRGPGLLGALTLAEQHYLFVELYDELGKDERAKIDPWVDRLFARYVERRDPPARE